MTNLLKQQQQEKHVSEWQAEIETCVSRLVGASENATRALTAKQNFIAIASTQEQTDTGAAMSEFLMGKAPAGVAAIAAIAKVFSGGTGKTIDELLAMVAVVAKQ